MKRTMKDIKVGDTFPTNQGSSVTITNIMSFNNITVVYNDKFRYNTTTTLQHLNSGSLKNPYFPNILGMGYIGVGPYIASVNGKNTIQYDAWRNMLKRCYCTTYQSTQPTYIGCTVSSEWLNFQIFAHWYCNHPNYGKGYHLDKDILVEGNKVYGPEFCVLVPEVINSLFRGQHIRSTNSNLPTGVYKHYNKFQSEHNGVHLGTFNTAAEAAEVYVQNKRNHILSLAEYYKCDLDADIYYALYALAHSI